MRFRKREPLLDIVLGTALSLIDDLRQRLPDNIGDIKSTARETYDTASDRLGRATRVLRGKERPQVLGRVGTLLAGLGIGIGIGLLIAPARGEETRADIADKLSDFGDKVRERTEKKPPSATGTYDE